MNLRWLAFLFLFAGPAFAQNVNCATRPVGDTSNACASTAFVQSAIGPGGSLQINSTLQFDGSGKLGAAVAPALFGVTSSANTEFSITVSSAPTYNFPENATGCSTEFDGDFSHTFLPLCYTVTGANTLGTPTGGDYQWNPAITPFQILIDNESGYPNLSSQNGRTAIAAYRVMMQQNGYGDAGGYSAFCSANVAAPSGSTNFLQGPACFAINGDMNAGASGTYLNTVEYHLKDNGNDAAAIGRVVNFYRTVNTAALGEVWFGDYLHSEDTEAIDAGWVLGGDGSDPTAINGLDTVTAILTGSAVNLAVDQRVTLNSTATALHGLTLYGNVRGNSYLAYVSADSSAEIVNGTTKLQVLGSQVQTNSTFVSGAQINAIGGFFENSVKGVSCSGALTVISSITIAGGIITAATGTGGTCS